MKGWAALTREVRRTMANHAPDWTDRNDADPGVILLEILAYLAEGLRLHAGVVEGGSAAASRIVGALDAYPDSESIVVRVNGELWQRVRTLEDAHPDARVFRLDAATGAIEFGDGVHGRVPGDGSVVSARYRDGSGGGRDASIAIRATWPFASRVYRASLGEDGSLQVERWPAETATV